MKYLRIFFLQHWFFVTTAVLYLGALIFKLTTHPTPFFDWDEPLYVQGGIEMIQHNYFLFPLWQGNIWFDKPPLSSLLYGLAAQLPIPVEISTRLLALSVSTLILTLFYSLYFKIIKNQYVATLSVAICSFLPIFLQRSQVVNLDVFLLIGWIGYFLFQKNFIVSTLFLFLSTQSKSLLGFYPLAMQGLFILFELYRKKLSKKAFLDALRIIALQLCVLSIWYIAMFLLYGTEFWTAHIVESHFRRVSASIESHFGQRTYYIDLLLEQLGWMSISACMGFLLLLYRWFKGKIDDKTFFLATVFIPWFLFLNITKTKIAWYLYPTLPQFAFLAVYPLVLLQKYTRITKVVVIGITIFILYTGFIKNNLIGTYYSTSGAHIRSSLYARGSCNNMAVLVDSQTRNTYSTLKKMNLTISTSDWWGDHPSMVYYFAKPIHFYYDKSMFIIEAKKYDCIVLHEEQTKISLPRKRMIGIFDDITLYHTLP